MARRNQGWRVLGPYAYPSRASPRLWKIIQINPEGDRAVSYAETEAAAREAIEAIQRELEGERTVSEAVGAYVEHRECLGRYTVTSRERLTRCLDQDVPLSTITTKPMVKWYARRTTEVAAASHRGELKELKLFFRWVVAKGWLPKSPVEKIEPVGELGAGKGYKLTHDELALWWEKAWEMAHRGDQGAVAALLVLDMGLRCQDITRRVVKDVDAGGTLLVIKEAKTRTSSGEFPIPPDLQPLVQQLCEGRKPEAPLFATGKGKHHWRDWPTEAIKRICRSAKVKETCQQALKRKRADVLSAQGMNLATVSRNLHHASTKVTTGHYLDAQAGQGAEQQQIRTHMANVVDLTSRRMTKVKAG